jgi:serine/threonine protein kinase
MSDSQEHVGFQAPDPAELKKLFPGYEIEGLIATGGMGAVYRAVQKSLDRTVALKILPQEFSKDLAFCEGFEAEAKAMARLNHPNLIGVYDFGEAGGMLYIIMEFVKGQSIYHSAHGQAIDSQEVIRMVSAVCSGLAHAHENGIIHRDIKPSNILLDLNAQPKIGDFGLARPIERKIQEGEEIFGTPHYTAPEVVDAPHSVDSRADIFSVGVMLHELLTGKLPADDPRPPSAIARCDPRFDVIVRRATHTNPAGRYSSAAEMAKDLATISTTAAAKRVVKAPGPRGVGRVGPRVAAPLQPRRMVTAKRSSSLPSFIMFLVLVAIGAGVYVYYSGLKPPEVKVPTEPPKQVSPAQTSETMAIPDATGATEDVGLQLDPEEMDSLDGDN